MQMNEGGERVEGRQEDGGLGGEGQIPLEGSVDPEAVGAEVMRTLEGIERQFEALRALKSTYAEESARVEEARRRVEEESSAVAEQRRALEERSASVERRAAELGERERVAEERERGIEQREAEVNAHQEEVRALGEELRGVESRLGERADALTRREEALGEREASLSEREQELRARGVATHEAEATARELRASLEKRERGVLEREDDLEQRAAQLAGRESTLAERLEEVERREREAEERLARAAGAGEEAEAAAALRETLEKDRASLDEQLEALEREREALGTRERELAERGDGGAEELERLGAEAASLREALAARERELEAARAEAGAGGVDPEEVAKRDKAIRMLKERLAGASERVAALEAELESGSGGAGAVGADAFNESRRARLRRQRALLGEQAKKIRKIKGTLAQRERQCEQVLELKQTLKREKAALRKASEQVERRAAKSRAGVFMLTLVLMVVAIAGASWPIAGQYAAGTYLADAEIGMEGASSADAEAVESWTGFHEDLLLDPQVLGRAADRMKRRGLVSMGDPVDLQAALEEGLDVSHPAPGRIELTLRGEGADRTARVLETYVASVVALANESRSRRLDGAATVVEASATAGSAPVDDARLRLWAVIAGGGSAVALFGTVVLWRVMLSRRRAIEASIDAVDEAEAEVWTESPSGGGRPV